MSQEPLLPALVEAMFGRLDDDVIGHQAGLVGVLGQALLAGGV